MKFNYRFLLLGLVAAVIMFPVQKNKAQELLVEWQNPTTGEVIVDALRNAIANDTNRPEGRVYKLQKGGFYWITEDIRNDGWHLRIVGEDPDPADEYGNPAFIQMVARADGSHNGRIITGGGSITLKNVYIVGADENGVQTYYQPVQIDANNSRFVFDNCIFERTNFALTAFTGSGNSIFYTNCKFRNLIGQPSTQQWEGRGISIWADQDTVVVENCTFFNVGMTALQIEGGAADYVRFNHNTLVNVGRSINTGNWWREAYFANNLVINGFWHGEGFGDYDLVRNPNRDPRAFTSGMFSIGSLPSKYGPEQGRRVLFTNTAVWRDPAFAAYYADTIRAQPFINPVTKLDFVNVYENMVVKDTMWLTSMPNIATYTPDIIQSMINNIKDLRASVTPATPWFWRLPEEPTVPSWPLPENFTYTDANLLTAGTDGLPLGDLNWFPAQKATYEANVNQYAEQLKNMAGPIKIYDVVETVEAEDGTLGGDASLYVFEGFSYFQMDGGGFIEWKFDLATAGEYELNVWTHLRNNNMRGQRIIVNGVSIHDPKGWGEYIWAPEEAGHPTFGMPINEWTWSLIKQSEILEAGALSLNAGQNTIRIESSWGWQNFAGINLILNGTIVKELRAPDATSYDIVQPRGEGAPWTPSKFKAVSLNNNGVISWNINVPNDGNYTLQIFYQNSGSPRVGQIKVNGTDVATVDFEVKADETGLSVLAPSFPVTAGTRTFSLASSNVNIDMVQLVKETIVVSVKDNQLPDGFSLEQNYPNPFNPTTTIRFTLGNASNIKLNIYNILGQKVATLLDAPMAAGTHTVNFNASHLASGVYIYSIEHSDFRVYKKMMLLK